MRPTAAASVAGSGWERQVVAPSAADLLDKTTGLLGTSCLRELAQSDRGRVGMLDGMLALPSLHHWRSLHRGLRSFAKRIQPWSISPTFGASTLFYAYDRLANTLVADPLSLGVRVQWPRIPSSTARGDFGPLSLARNTQQGCKRPYPHKQGKL